MNVSIHPNMVHVKSQVIKKINNEMHLLQAQNCLQIISYEVSVTFLKHNNCENIESAVLLLGEEASPNIENTLWRVSTMFTRSAITPPEVNEFG